ncbi:hypothetical protein [Hydrogenobacter thermophilus]|uniref:hypothetical protein n=1 Tax=Hydrogenobacter thermophilus TaxID=940 RepID=UPI0030F999B0
MALKIAREDLIIGSFVIFALFYPFFITFFIWYQDYSKEKNVLKTIDPFILFILGEVDCSDRAFERIKGMLSSNFLQTYGENNLKNLCQQNKSMSLKPKKKLVKVHDNEVEFYGTYEGDTGFAVNLHLKAELQNNGVVIREFSYEKGG